MQIAARFTLWRDILIRPTWRWVVNTPFLLISAATWARDEFLNEQSQEKLRIPGIVSDWSWEPWALIGLVITILIVLESSFRVVRNKKMRSEGKERLLKKRIVELEDAQNIGEIRGPRVNVDLHLSDAHRATPNIEGEYIPGIQATMFAQSPKLDTLMERIVLHIAGREIDLPGWEPTEMYGGSSRLRISDYLFFPLPETLLNGRFPVEIRMYANNACWRSNSIEID